MINVRSVLLALALAAVLVPLGSAAEAKCNKVCQAKCAQAVGASSGPAYQACFAEWSAKNAALRGNKAAIKAAEAEYRNRRH